ncbi:MAG: homocysteine S-methyltransferase family protein, partial [bacterium]
VWASAGPLGLGLRFDDFGADELRGIFRQQFDALKAADALLLETFVDAREARLALEAARDLGLPVIFQVGHVGGGRERYRRLDALLDLAVAGGVVAVGANCQHPDDMVHTVEYLAGRTELPVTAAPNAGHPSFERGLVRYEVQPPDFATISRRLVAAGAAVVGGCCGTMPEHIRVLAGAVGGRPVRQRRPVEVREVEAPGGTIRAAARDNRIRRLMAGDRFVISVEIRAERRGTLDSIVAGAGEVAAAGCDMFDVPDNPGATVGRDAMVMAAALQERLRIPSIPHRSVIQANLLQAHSSLLGCWDLGLDGVLVVTGDPPSMGHLGGMAKVVSDLKSSVEMLRLIRSLREGRMINGEEVGDPPDFCAGCAVGRAVKPQVAWLQKKIDAGAEFVFSQPVFTPDDYRILRDAVAGLPIRFFPGVMPLVSRKSAEFLAGGRIPGIRVPESLVADLSRYAAPADQKKLGMDRALELAAVIAREGRGIYLIMPFGKSCYTDTAEIVRTVRRTV